MSMKVVRWVQRNSIDNRIMRASQMKLSRVYSIILKINNMAVTPARMLPVILLFLHSIISATINNNRN
jgi:hypothetical protein